MRLDTTATLNIRDALSSSCMPLAMWQGPTQRPPTSAGRQTLDGGLNWRPQEKNSKAPRVEGPSTPSPVAATRARCVGSRGRNDSERKPARWTPNGLPWRWREKTRLQERERRGTHPASSLCSLRGTRWGSHGSARACLETQCTSQISSASRAQTAGSREWCDAHHIES